MSSQQTVLRVQTNIPSTTLTGQTETRDLDLYSDVPIKIFRSFAEVQDISKRNSDYTIGLSLPGSKRNNVFFENFYDVNQQTLYFDATKRVPAKVVIDGDIYFRGYLKLDKISVINSKVEYSVTLYSEIADLYGAIGNGLLKDLDYSSINHELRNEFVINDWNGPNYQNGEPLPYLYSVIHNGYLYDGEFPDYGITNLYSSTITGNWATLAEAQAATLPNRINSVQSADSAGGIYLNQMKPALNVKWLVEKIITERGYTIKSDFFKTPWFKLLYLYGYFNSADSVLSATFENYEVLPKTGVDIRYIQEDLGDGHRKVTYYVVKRGTGIPCICSEPLYVVNRFRWDRFFLFPDQFVNYTSTILPNNTTLIIDTNNIDFPNRDKFDWLSTFISPSTGGGVGFYEGGMTYLPEEVGDTIPIDYGDEVNFAKIMSKDIKQIDFLASIAKKFNLLFIPNPVNPKEILIEPYDYYIGTGDIYDWSDKLATDRGYSIEPALNFIETELVMTDKEDGDAGNKSYKDKFDRIYGENKIYNPTEFKSSTKTIDTIFSPQIISKWDTDVTNPKVGNIGLPLAINYVEGTSTLSGNDDNEVNINIFEGVKTKPKLFYHCGNFSPFLDAYGELIQTPFSATNYTTWYPKIQRPGSTQINTLALAKRLPVVSHTIPTGNPDSNKINNDSACILFNSEQPVNLAGVPTYNTYTDNDVYSLYYENRINNLFNPQTRFFKGKFDLKLNDIKNLKPNDIIKLNGQYFTWNKIAGYDLTNPPQLTEVELIQVEINPRVYPTRYFEYYYNDDPSEKFSIVSDFTNDSYEGTNYAWSVTYDYFVGVLGGSVSGYTSSVKDTTQGTFAYIPYTIYEVSEEHYLSGSTIDRSGDPIYIWSKTFGPDLGDTYPVWGNSASGTDTYEWLNVFSNYSDFQSKKSPWFFTEGASNTHGSAITPTPTSTPTPTPTPTPDQQEPGSLIIDYTKIVDLKSHNYSTFVNTIQRDRHFDNTENLYTTYLNDGDNVVINLFCVNSVLYDYDYSVIRRDYTNDDQGGDMGIIDTEITAVTKNTLATQYQLVFTVDTNPDAYNYEYRLIITEKARIKLFAQWNIKSPYDNDTVEKGVELFAEEFPIYTTPSFFTLPYSGSSFGYQLISDLDITDKLGETSATIARTLCEVPLTVDDNFDTLRYVTVTSYYRAIGDSVWIYNTTLDEEYDPVIDMSSYECYGVPGIPFFDVWNVPLAVSGPIESQQFTPGYEYLFVVIDELVFTEKFKFTIDTRFTDFYSTPSNAFALPLIQTTDGGVYDFVVDWGDGTTSVVTGLTETEWNNQSGPSVHYYDTPGEYDISISGVCKGFSFCRSCWSGHNTDSTKLVRITNWGDPNYFDPTYVYPFDGYPYSIGVFENCDHLLEITALNTPLLPSTPNVRGLIEIPRWFENCTSLTTITAANQWDVSNLTSLDGLFKGCTNLDIDISNWDVSNVQWFSLTFYDCSSFNSDISGWNTSSATLMKSMFYGCSSFNQNISGWDVSNVINTGAYGEGMGFMFQNATSFNQDLSGWCVSLIPSEPTDFDTGATSWVLPRPVWGTCPP